MLSVIESEPPVAQNSYAVFAVPLKQNDESGDIETFRVYVSVLSDDALWDINAHLDHSQFPERAIAIRDELSRRGRLSLDAVPAREMLVRKILLACFLLTVSVAIFKMLGGAYSDPHPSERFFWFVDLAAGIPKTARGLFTIGYPFAILGGVVSAVTSVHVLFLSLKRKVKRETDLLAVVLTALTLVLLRFIGG